MTSSSLPMRTEPMRARQRWTILVTSTSGALETFDVVIYGFFAQEIGRAFFPASAALSTVTLSFAVFALGFLARPLGGLFFGHLGDRYGRRRVFAWSAIVAALSTLLIASLPTYRMWGVAAPFLLLTLRLTQGFCVGGELPGAIVYAVETERMKPGFSCGIVFFAVNMALLLAVGINLVEQRTLTPAQIDTFGWRIGFLAGGVIGLLSFVLRRTLPETDAYARAGDARERKPLSVLLRDYRRPVVVGMVASMLVGLSNGLLVTHAAAWLRLLHYEPQRIAAAQTLHVVAISACMLLIARMGDVVPRRYLFRAGAVLAALFAPVFYLTLARHQADLRVVFLMAAVVASFANGTFACAIAELFPVGVRYSGVALAINVGLAMTMGVAPLGANMLIARTGSMEAPVFLLVFGAVLAFVASFGMKRSWGGREVAQSDEAGDAGSVVVK
ncbi:MFS transporter [Paraburkholderia domus]|uniref:Proline/betaine transporter n=1 Tax=Paraburkholderia domus TaxID=2793075 RepID=A0A9N8MZ92_9BURK|nr:MFS transporter [Paraburkholderia domus]MBK5167236.1 MFS transporter [Burkholderia sp. R-70211]CAE6925425.1 Proline/betaine transporter [Paraburkholderia domus]